MAELKQFKQLFRQCVGEEVNFTVEKMVKIVGDKYDLDKRELFNLLEEFYDNEAPELDQSSREVCHSEINENKCLGKTKFGTQCTRNRHTCDNGEVIPSSKILFCASHSTKLPYGRVDEVSDVDKNIKRRGRPRKE